MSIRSIDGLKCKKAIDKMLGITEKENLAIEALSIMQLKNIYLKELGKSVARINALTLKELKIKNKLRI